MLTQLTSLQICHGKIWAVFLAGHLRQLCMLVLGARCSMTNPPEHRHHVIFWCPSKFMWMFEVLSNVCVFSKTGPVLVYCTSTWEILNVAMKMLWQWSVGGGFGTLTPSSTTGASSDWWRPTLMPIHDDMIPLSVDWWQAMSAWPLCCCSIIPLSSSATGPSPSWHVMSSLENAPFLPLEHYANNECLRCAILSSFLTHKYTTMLWWFFILTTSARSRSQHPQQCLLPNGRMNSGMFKQEVLARNIRRLEVPICEPINMEERAGQG